MSMTASARHSTRNLSARKPLRNPLRRHGNYVIAATQILGFGPFFAESLDRPAQPNMDKAWPALDKCTGFFKQPIPYIGCSI